jgi:ribosomal protein S18 acetylase RimI-like enzyme
MKPSQISIRYASQQDAGLLADLGAKTFIQTYSESNPFENIDAYVKEFFSPEKQKTEISDSSNLFLIAEYEGQVFGYAQVSSGNQTPEITSKNPIELVRIYLLPEFIGKGLGSSLMQACLQESLARGHDAIWLGVWEHNQRAIAFYEKWGFKKIGTHQFTLGADLQTDWIMALDLSTAD